MTYQNKQYDQERALYNLQNCEIINCQFKGEADGESPLKECKSIKVLSCELNLRYPLWHNDDLNLIDSQMNENCRAPLWYCKHVNIQNTNCIGVKAVRECNDVIIRNSVFDSEEFGWKSNHLTIQDSSFSGNYFLFNTNHVRLKNSKLNGKYSFQYMHDVIIENCQFNTKDAFWHSKNVVVVNSVLQGEYIAWYSTNLTFINCIIKGTQPFCYCKKLKLINCKFEDADFAFENSEVNATIVGKMISIKNPLKGKIIVDDVNEIIIKDYTKLPKGKIIVKNKKKD